MQESQNGPLKAPNEKCSMRDFNDTTNPLFPSTLVTYDCLPYVPLREPSNDPQLNSDITMAGARVDSSDVSRVFCIPFAVFDFAICQR